MQISAPAALHATMNAADNSFAQASSSYTSAINHLNSELEVPFAVKVGHAQSSVQQAISLLTPIAGGTDFFDARNARGSIDAANGAMILLSQWESPAGPAAVADAIEQLGYAEAILWQE